MKKFLVFTLLLANSYIAFACGFYPYGEEVRMYFLNPNHFNCHSFNGFHYSSRSFGLENPYKENEVQPNDQLWFDYCLGKVLLNDIIEAVYQIPVALFTEKNNNKMIQYLYQRKDFEVIDYLKFAKSCEIANLFYSDPWEREDKVEINIIEEKINEAVNKSENTKNVALAIRYKFIAIRMAFYAGRSEEVISIYESLPKSDKPTILYYWSLYFRTLVEENKALQSFYACQVFANAPDKRFAIHFSFDKTIAINSILEHAKTDEERANVYALAATKKVDKSLNYIKKAFELNPNSTFNTFIVLREINKIEDWIFTPYYTTFYPSLEENPYQWNGKMKFSYSVLEKRINSDRMYANEVFQFLKRLPKTNTQLEICKAHLAFVAKQYDDCEGIIKSIEKKITDKDSLFNEMQIIKALNTTANQTENKAIITKEVQNILLNNKNNDRFLFAIARELEYLGNTTDAAFLFSKINEDNNYSEGYFEGSNLTWKSRKHRKGSYVDYFSNYFEYLDVIYTPKQLETVIELVNSNKISSEFDIWMNSRLLKEKSKLYDLLGTKYIRQNNLKKALENFKKTGDRYWIENYSLWKDQYYASQKIFDKNPFYSFKNTPEFINEKEDFYLTKETVTEKLIDYLAKANDPNEKDRDFYYFIVGNCYKNMMIHGNSWMMRRFGVSSYDVAPFPEDEAEFQNGYLAKKYYRLAYKYSKSVKFKSLCLWLAEDYKQLKMETEDEYYDLSNRNCYAFEDYFKARK